MRERPKVDMELCERQRALVRPLEWGLDTVARADEPFGRELHRCLQQTRRNVMSTSPSVFGPDATLATAWGRSTQEKREVMLRRLAGVRKGGLHLWRQHN